MTHRPTWRAMALAATVALAACAAPGTNTPTETTAQGGLQAERVVRGSNTLGRVVTVAARPSSAPAVVSAPAPVQTTETGTPTPAPTPLPSPPIALTPAHEAVRADLNTKLAGLARIGFLQSQADLLSSNSAGVLSNNAAGVISNNAGGIISDNGLGLVSNNGGGIISDNGLGYHVAQAAEAITTGPLQGEELAFGSLYADGSRQLNYYVPATFTPDKPNMRVVRVNPAGHGVSQTQRNVSEVYAGHLPKQVEDTQIQADAEGRFQCDLVAGLLYDQSGLIQTVAIAPDKMHWRDATSGVSIDVGGFSLAFADDKASYSYTFTKIGQVEKGDLTKLRRRADKNVVINLMHPEFMGDVVARVEKTDGTLLYGKTITYVDAGHSLYTYDLQDGFVLKFDREEGNRLLGKLSINGHEEADAFLERRSGAHIFSITFPEEPNRPIVVGYGNLGAPDSPGSTQAVWNVTTAAGSATAGRANGAGAAASFTALAGLVRSNVNPNRLYVADQGAHVIRTLDVNPATNAVTVGTYAGTGAPGAADGPAASASFNAPLGLAVGPDDTLYVADSGNHKIRAIAPDGTVSTFAGSGVQGVGDGAAAAAGFVMPAGLALSADGTLYVSDAGVSTLRKVASGVVSTFAGSPTVTGNADGTGTAARFNTPTALAFAKDGNLLVADANNFALRQVTPQGVVTTLVGNADPNTYVLDGPADQTAINNFKAIAIGPSGTPYLGGDNIRMLRPDGQVGTYVGGHAVMFQDSEQYHAAFLAIQGLAFGPNNILYVSDGTRLRKVTPKNAPTP